MSQENVEVIRAALDAFNRGDFDAMLKYAAPDFELDWSRAVGARAGASRSAARDRGLLSDQDGRRSRAIARWRMGGVHGDDARRGDECGDRRGLARPV